eukprot:TRINITY_DN27812_c0_g1_i1.p1 TRINITY_DN27812_c0_g1~~TRINITY_DN27812_c0_g1_i1.p1  ORF type:complete len:943 (-),score=240.95 TRINITY_DN27812_c0_g1_i1:7-2835(-)
MVTSAEGEQQPLIFGATAGEAKSPQSAAQARGSAAAKRQSAKASLDGMPVPVPRRSRSKAGSPSASASPESPRLPQAASERAPVDFASAAPVPQPPQSPADAASALRPPAPTTPAVMGENSENVDSGQATSAKNGSTAAALGDSAVVGVGGSGARRAGMPATQFREQLQALLAEYERLDSENGMLVDLLSTHQIEWRGASSRSARAGSTGQDLHLQPGTAGAGAMLVHGGSMLSGMSRRRSGSDGSSYSKQRKETKLRQDRPKLGPQNLYVPQSTASDLGKDLSIQPSGACCPQHQLASSGPPTLPKALEKDSQFLWKLNKTCENDPHSFDQIRNWRRRHFVLRTYPDIALAYQSEKNNAEYNVACVLGKWNNCAIVEILDVIELEPMVEEVSVWAIDGICNYSIAIDQPIQGGREAARRLLPQRLYGFRCEWESHTVVLAADSAEVRDVWLDRIQRVQAWSGPCSHDVVSHHSTDFNVSLMKSHRRRMSKTSTGQRSGGEDMSSREEQWLNSVEDWCSRAVVCFDSLKEPERTGCLASFVDGSLFTAIVVLIILCNLALVVYEVDHAMRYSMEPAGAKAAEWGFTVFYLIEMILRITVHRQYYFTSRWNIFDFLLVLLQVVDLIDPRQDGLNAGWLRAMRLVQASRFLVMLRTVRFIKELRLMLASLIGCVGPALIWGLLLMSGIMLFFSVVFVGAAAWAMKEADDDQQKALRSNFGSVQVSMITLFKAVSGGDDWGNIYDVVVHSGEGYGFFFIFFVYCFQGAVFNVMTGIFVEKAVQAATPTDEEQMLQRRQQEITDMEELTMLCQRLDKDGSGNISLEEFKDTEVFEFFALRGLDITNTDSFLQMLMSVHETEELSIKSFVAACMKLRGSASRLDVSMLSFQCQLIQASAHRFHAYVREQFRKLDLIAQRLEGGSPVHNSGIFPGMSSPKRGVRLDME